MIQFIFVITVFAFILLVIAFIIKQYIIGLLSGISLIVIGVYMAINGIGGITTLLVDALAILCICLGAYVFINGSIEKMKEVE